MVAQSIQLGDLSFLLDGGAVRLIRWRGVEAVRSIDAPFRDANWGTLPQTDIEEKLEQDGRTLSYHRRFRVAGSVAGDLLIEGRCRRTPDSAAHL